jgi:hypothetical protein
VEVISPYDLSTVGARVFPKLPEPIGWIMWKRPERWWERLLGIPTGYAKKPIWPPDRYYVWSRG